MSTTALRRPVSPDPAVTGEAGDTARPSSVRQVLCLSAGLLAAVLPLMAFGHAVEEAAALHTMVSTGGPWLPAATWGTVLKASLAVAGALVLLFAPGLLIALTLNRARTTSEWVLYGFPLSLLSISGAAWGAQALLGAPFTGSAFVLLVVACTVVSAAGLLVRVRSRDLHWPLAGRSDAHTLAGMVVVPLTMLIALAPKFFWEAFNGDGAHAYEAARLLLHQAVPFWDPASGVVAGFPGASSFLFAYPASWFIRLFGELEVSARLPLLLFLPALAAGLFALIEHGRAGRGAAPDRWLVWLALAVYVVVISFSATYSPYSADIALPATQDTLVVVAFLGFTLAFLRGERGWSVIWAFLTYASLPNGLLLMGFLLAAWLLVQKPRPFGDVARGAAAVGAALVMAVLLPHALAAAGAAVPGGEYGLSGVIRRFAFLQVTDVIRLTYVIVPCGILPALMMLRWPRQDPLARTLTVVAISYFLFAFVQAHAPLHYYIPAMVLPLVVHWRMAPGGGAARTRWTMATAIAAMLALVVSWPAEPGPYTAARDVGASIDIEVAGYDRMSPEPFAASALLQHIVPLDWDPTVPQESFGGSPIVFQYYAFAGDRREPGNYVLQLAGAPPPQHAEEVVRADGYALYVRNRTVWDEHLALRPATPAGARLFQQPRSIMFRSVPHTGKPWIIDLPEIAGDLGIDVEAIAARLGVVRH